MPTTIMFQLWRLLHEDHCHAASMTYQGRSISVTLMEEKYIHGGPNVRHTLVYVSDEAPGRILQIIDRGYGNDGGPLGVTTLNLSSASLQ